MKGLAICNRGIEEIASLEVKELLGKDSQRFEGYVTFDIGSKEELSKLIYLGQSIRQVCLVLKETTFSSKEDILAHAKNIDLKEWLNEKRSFKVDAESNNPHIDHEHIKGEAGGAIVESIKDYKQKVSMENPDVIVCLFIDKNRVYFCIDFSGRDLSKRSYRIYSHPRNIKSTIAYAMVRLSGYKEGERLLDPFCLSGTIPIEASLYENKLSVNYYEKEQFAFIKFMDFDFEKVDKKSTKDKGNIFAFDSQFKNADAARKNAKIAGINKAINFSRLEIEWLDTKFDEESVDRIVCFPPHIPKFGDKNITIKLYDELFHQAEFILKKKGTVLICTINPIEIKEAAAKKKFNLDFERGVWQGKEKLTLLKLSK